MTNADHRPVETPEEASARRSWEAIRRFTPSVETRSDRQILERLIAAFKTGAGSRDVSAISFFVRNRVVTINGLIRDSIDREPLIGLAASVAGVERVIDRLRIVPERSLKQWFRRSA